MKFKFKYIALLVLILIIVVGVSMFLMSAKEQVKQLTNSAPKMQISLTPNKISSNVVTGTGSGKGGGPPPPILGGGGGGSGGKSGGSYTSGFFITDDNEMALRRVDSLTDKHSVNVMDAFIKPFNENGFFPRKEFNEKSHGVVATRINEFAIPIKKEKYRNKNYTKQNYNGDNAVSTIPNDARNMLYHEIFTYDTMIVSSKIVIYSIYAKELMVIFSYAGFIHKYLKNLGQNQISLSKMRISVVHPKIMDVYFNIDTGGMDLVLDYTDMISDDLNLKTYDEYQKKKINIVNNWGNDIEAVFTHIIALYGVIKTIYNKSGILLPYTQNELDLVYMVGSSSHPKIIYESFIACHFFPAGHNKIEKGILQTHIDSFAYFILKKSMRYFEDRKLSAMSGKQVRRFEDPEDAGWPVESDDVRRFDFQSPLIVPIDLNILKEIFDLFHAFFRESGFSLKYEGLFDFNQLRHFLFRTPFAFPSVPDGLTLLTYPFKPLYQTHIQNWCEDGGVFQAIEYFYQNNDKYITRRAQFKPILDAYLTSLFRECLVNQHAAVLATPDSIEEPNFIYNQQLFDSYDFFKDFMYAKFLIETIKQQHGIKFKDLMFDVDSFRDTPRQIGVFLVEGDETEDHYYNLT